MKVYLTIKDHRVSYNSMYDSIYIKLSSGELEFDNMQLMEVDINTKLEFHVDGQEVVGVPIISGTYAKKIRCVNFNLFNPIQGTFNSLKLKLQLKDNSIKLTDDLIIIIKLMSKNFWQLFQKKLNDGVKSESIDIVELIE